MNLLDWLSATAVSFTISGNTGIAPFSSLFLVGLLEATNPDLLNMDGTIERMLSSWYGLIILGILSILEFVGKCVPVIDEIIDSALTFVVPIFSILGSLSTFGLFSMVNNGGDADAAAGDDVTAAMDDQGRRHLSVASGTLVFFQVIVVAIGIVLALCLHGIKMLVRLLGEGCLTNCITVLEYTWIGLSITLAVFVREIAICIAILFCFVAVYMIKRRLVDKKTVEEIAQEDGAAVRAAVVIVEADPQGTNASSVIGEQDFVKMDEEQAGGGAVQTATATAAAVPATAPSESSTLMESK